MRMPKRVIYAAYAIAKMQSENGSKSQSCCLLCLVDGQIHAAAYECPVGMSGEIRELWDYEGDAKA